jgi:DedD protein
METTLKQRLIGAAVIIALAVIFVPMILDGSGRRESTAMNMEVPPEPTFSFESELPDPKKLDELPPIAKSTESSEASKQEEAKPMTAEKPQKTEIKSEDKTEVATATQTTKPTSKITVVEATENHIKTNPALNAWAVQVAAFGEKSKALALQEKLLASKLSAFTEQSGSGNKLVYRVKVGPELERENADKLRDKIEREYGLKGSFVTKHP